MGSLCGGGVGRASGHCVSSPRSHQDSHFTHPPRLPGIKPSKGLISDCAVMTSRTSQGILEIDFVGCPCGKFLPVQCRTACARRGYTAQQRLPGQPPGSGKDPVTRCSWLCLGPGLAAAHVPGQMSHFQDLTKPREPRKAPHFSVSYHQRPLVTPLVKDC